MMHRPVLLCSGLFVAAAFSIGCDKKNPDPIHIPPPPVVVAHPVERQVVDYQVFTARTQAVQSVDVKPRVTGYLKKFTFKDGDLVKKDQVLFEIDDRPYKATLDATIAALDEAKAMLEEAKASLDLSKAALVKSQAEYDIGLDVKKMNPGAISEQELTRRMGARDEAKASVEKAKAGIPRAQSSIDQAQANLIKAQLNYDWCKVQSPIDGRVNRHFVDVGNLVSQDVTTLTNIVSVKPMWAYFDVDENRANYYQEQVDKGQVKSFRDNNIDVTMALGNSSEFSFKGATDFVSNQFDANTGSVRLRAIFTNDDGKLSSGQFARIRVPSSSPHKAILISDRAIGTDQGQKFILIVNEKKHVERRSVEVGQLHDGLREIKPVKGSPAVTKADWVIIDGLQRARPGSEVNVKEADMPLGIPKN